MNMLRPFIHAFRGLITVWKEESHFRVQVFATLLVLFSIYYFTFSFFESVVVLFATVLVLSAEIINTAIEDVCNKIEPNQDRMIGKIKDVMSAFVLVTSLGAFIVGILTFCHHFISV